MRDTINIMAFFRIAGLAVVLLVSAVAAGAEGDAVTLYYSSNPEGIYELTAIYDVAPEIALEAFAADPASKSGDQSLYSKLDDNIMQSAGSGEAFADFLEANYGTMEIRAGERCDKSVNANWVLSCPFDCSPPSNCFSWVHYSVTITCLNQPPCLGTDICNPHAEDLIAFRTNIVPACYCNESNVCTLHDGTVVNAFWTRTPVCVCEVVGTAPVGACQVDDACLDGLTQAQCADQGGTWLGAGVKCGQDHMIPTLSEWGLIIFSLLILSLVTVVVTRRRTATSAAGVSGTVTIGGPVFVPARFIKALTVTLGIAAAVLITAIAISGSIPVRDIFGTIISAGIVAYIAHLWIMPKEKE